MSEKKILIVDDEPCFIDVLTARLASKGFSVCSARNGEEAIAKAKSEKPLVIIMDVMMPMTSGFEAIQKIRQDPETKKIPAIIFSAKAGMKDFFEDIPGVEFLHKPFDFQLLVGRVEALVGGIQQRASQPKCVVLAGVEDLLVSKIRSFLSGLNFNVFTALNEANTVQLTKNIHPDMVFCQFWEDEHILNSGEIAQQILANASVSATPFYVFCKESLSLEAMKHFQPDQIVTYKESSDLLSKIQVLVGK